jgi:hypothetical protein
MKKRQLIITSVLGLIVLSLMVAGPAFSQGRGQGFRACPYSPYKCPVKNTCKPFDEGGAGAHRDPGA